MIKLSNKSLKNFEDKIYPEPNTGCWLWAGCESKGYGQFGINGIMKYAHRISYQVYKGIIPKRLHVLHKCDNPACVNPDHLFLGTHQDNMKDRDAKGRQARLRGEDSPLHILNQRQVIMIKKMIIDDIMLVKDMAKKFKVSESTISAIKRGQNWGHITILNNGQASQ